jgi:hypothetical protein
MILTYLVLLVIVFLGLFIGLLIGYLCEEELKPGMKYLELLRHLLFIAILVKNPSLLFILLIALLIIAFSFSRHRETLYYYALAVIFFLSWRYNGLVILAPLIFLYSFPLGSIYLYNHIKENKKQVILGMFYKYAGFLINGIALGLLGLLF